MAETAATKLGRQEDGAMLGISRTSRYVAHAVLIVGILIVAFPIYYTFVASTHTLQTILRPPLPLLPGDQFWQNYSQALFGGVGRIGGVGVDRLLWNTTVVALAIAIGKIVISILSAYAIVFFRFPFRMTFFWLIFITLMLPVEVRIMPTYKVMVDFGLIDTYTGLTLPLMASATATLLFRQFFLTIRANWSRRPASMGPGRGASIYPAARRVISRRCSSSSSSTAGRIRGRLMPTATT